MTSKSKLNEIQECQEVKSITFLASILLISIGLLTQNIIFADESISPSRPKVTTKQYNNVNSIQSLTEQLINGLSSDLDKAKAIYTWIGENISYDTQAYFSGNYQDSNAYNTFITRKSVCQGYAELFNEMATFAGLEAKVISGYAKGYGYKLNDKITGTNHAWNVVKINNDWKLIDTTWGSGSINSQNKFERRFNYHYFLTDPKRFIYDHLPEDPNMQLLNPPVSKAEFSNLPKIYKNFYILGLDFIDQIYSQNQSEDEEFHFELKAPEDVIFTSNLIEGNTKLSRNYIWTERKDDKVLFTIRFPRSGNFKVELFAKSKDKTDALYDGILNFNVKASHGNPDNYFPQTFGQHENYEAVLIEPIDGVLKTRSNYHFKVFAPEGLKAAIIRADGEWVHLEKEGDVFSGMASISYGTNKISVQYPGNPSFYTVAEFEGK